MDINKKLNELPVFMKEKSIDISAAIGSIGLVEAEAIIKDNIGFRTTVSNDINEIEKIRQLEKFKLEKMQEKQ
jgi:hypothetical protein